MTQLKRGLKICALLFLGYLLIAGLWQELTAPAPRFDPCEVVEQSLECAAFGLR